MSTSARLLTLARRWPRTGLAIATLLGRWYLATGHKTHWVFDRLRAQAGVRFSRPLRLATGQVIHGDPFDLIGHHIQRHGLYEPETVAVFQRLVGPGMTVVDAGANIGQYTLIAASLVGPQGQVHAFEPNPVCLADLLHSLRDNGITQAHANELGLWHEATEAKLYEGDVENMGASSLRPGRFTTGAATAIRLTTLDAYAQQAGLTRLDLIKADVEGAELRLLEGAGATIARFRPVLLMEFSEQSEAFGSSKVAQAAWLLERGYRLWLITGNRLAPYQPTDDWASIANVACFPAERLGEPAIARLTGPPA